MSQVVVSLLSALRSEIQDKNLGYRCFYRTTIIKAPMNRLELGLQFYALLILPSRRRCRSRLEHHFPITVFDVIGQIETFHPLIFYVY